MNRKYPAFHECYTIALNRMKKEITSHRQLDHNTNELKISCETCKNILSTYIQKRTELGSGICDDIKKMNLKLRIRWEPFDSIFDAVIYASTVEHEKIVYYSTKDSLTMKSQFEGNIKECREMLSNFFDEMIARNKRR